MKSFCNLVDGAVSTVFDNRMNHQFAHYFQLLYHLFFWEYINKAIINLIQFILIYSKKLNSILLHTTQTVKTLKREWKNRLQWLLFMFTIHEIIDIHLNRSQAKAKFNENVDNNNTRNFDFLASLHKIESNECKKRLLSQRKGKTHFKDLALDSSFKNGILYILLSTILRVTISETIQIMYVCINASMHQCKLQTILCIWKF